MSDILEEKYVKPYKIHICIWCGETIKRREECWYTKIIFDGSLYNDYYHLECEDAARKFTSENDMEDGFDSYSFVRGSIERNNS